MPLRLLRLRGPIDSEAGGSHINPEAGGAHINPEARPSRIYNGLTLGGKFPPRVYPYKIPDIKVFRWICPGRTVSTLSLSHTKPQVSWGDRTWTVAIGFSTRSYLVYLFAVGAKNESRNPAGSRDWFIWPANV